jgi:hypothetical protein
MRTHTAQPGELLFSGTLVADAQVRNKPVGLGGQMVPVLCLELQPDHSTNGNTLHAEQPFTEATRHAAELRAQQLRAGMQVTVATPHNHMRLVLHSCTHVHVAKPAHQPTQTA